MNNVNLIGNLARAIEIKDLGNGRIVGRGLLAVSRYGKREGCDFIRITLWSQQALNAAKYLAKGSRVGIAGRLRSEFYERKSGERSELRLDTEVVVEDIQYLSPPPFPTAGTETSKGRK